MREQKIKPAAHSRTLSTLVGSLKHRFVDGCALCVHTLGLHGSLHNPTLLVMMRIWWRPHCPPPPDAVCMCVTQQCNQRAAAHIQWKWRRNKRNGMRVRVKCCYAIISIKTMACGGEAQQQYSYIYDIWFARECAMSRLLRILQTKRYAVDAYQSMCDPLPIATDAASDSDFNILSRNK